MSELKNEITLARLSLDSTRVLEARRSRAGLFGSPVLQLIEYVYATYPGSARSHLRRPIEVDRALSFPERMLVQSAAKRARVVDFSAAVQGTRLEIVAVPFSRRAPSPLGALHGEQIRARLQDILDEGPEESMPRHASDRAIAALLLSRTGSVLAEARNEGGTIRCRHAEMNLIRSLPGERIPREAILVSTLKPCRMCAAWIAAHAENFQDLRVFYVENDPGHGASSTALDARSAGRLEFLRERIALSPADAQRVIAMPEYAVEVQRQLQGQSLLDGEEQGARDDSLLS